MDEAERLHYKLIVGGDFNTELHVGHRGNFVDEFEACGDCKLQMVKTMTTAGPSAAPSG